MTIHSVVHQWFIVLEEIIIEEMHVTATVCTLLLFFVIILNVSFFAINEVKRCCVFYQSFMKYTARRSCR